MLKALSKAKLSCEFINLSSLAFVLPRVTKVLLSASACFTNGSVLGRVGTSAICLAATNFKKPVLFCSETFKFSDKVQLNSLSYNEIADPDDLLLPSEVDSKGKKISDPCIDWRDTPSVSLLNLVYDVTPMECITAIVTEIGVLPPTSIPVIIREQREALESLINEDY